MHDESPPAAGNAFSRWLAAELRARRLSQRALAGRSRVDHSTISRILRGDRVPSLGTTTRIAEALGAHSGGEILADPGADTSSVGRTRDALEADPALNELDVAAVMRLYLRVRSRRSRRSGG
jgi:transcriptional regulator with XRE-family HTH domain